MSDDFVAALGEYHDYHSFEQRLTTMGVTLASAIIIVGAQRLRNRKSLKVPVPKSLSWPEHAIAFTLALSVFLNIIYKWLTGWKYLGFLLYPCHLLSFSYAYIFYSKNDRLSTSIWNTIVFMTYLPTLALLLPDTSDLQFPFQKHLYWGQHIALVLAPVVAVWYERYPLERKDSHWFWNCVAVSISVAWLIHLPLSMLLGVNINYLLWPPPGMITDHILSGKYYHLKMCGLFFCATWLTGYPFIWAVESLRRKFKGSSSQKAEKTAAISKRTRGKQTPNAQKISSKNVLKRPVVSSKSNN